MVLLIESTQDLVAAKETKEKGKDNHGCHLFVPVEATGFGSECVFLDTEFLLNLVTDLLGLTVAQLIRAIEDLLELVLEVHVPLVDGLEVLKRLLAVAFSL